MPKFLVRGWINFEVEAEDETAASELVWSNEVSHPYLDEWGVDEVQEWDEDWDA